MQYCSTRGGVHGWSFQDVLFSGYAPDGGMFMPEYLPKLSPDTLRSWSKMTYPEVVMEVTSLFIPTQVIPREDLQGLVYAALSGFSVPEAVRLVRLKDGLSVLELFHGETLAFKDLAMTCSVRFLDYLLQKERRRATIIICTSGDTGGSAVQSAKGLSAMDVVVLYPAGRVTPVQEKHMITCLEDNLHVFSAGGTSDDLDVLACHLFADQELVKRHGLMSLNSVNWSRVMLQLAHFIYAYLQMSVVEGSERDTPLPLLEVVVPTGGAGNIAAGCIVKHMGVPLQMVAMVNANDTLHRTVRSGDFSKAASVTQTLASAIDIQFPYNMERVFWLLSGRDGALVTKIMEEFHSDKHTLSDNLHKALSQVLSTETVSDEGIVETMKKCWEENQYLLCPHTAVGVWHYYHCNPDPAIYRCYIATASPAKFEGAVHRAGLTVDLPEAVRALDKMPTRSQHLERSLHWLTDWEDRMRERLQAITSARDQSVTYYN